MKLPQLLPATAMLAATTVLIFLPGPAKAEWKPVPGSLTTEWTDKVDPAHPLPEYPRPQLERKEWVNLNGLWDYAITEKDAAAPEHFDGQILVPYPIESALSGVRKPLKATDRLWYRRSFTAPDLSGGKRLLLHFGAVDWQADVSVNGKAVGEHKGGYDAFTFDITDALKAGDNELVVSVWDSTGKEGEAKGKQQFSAMEKPGGIMYTPCSGIWQTVWMEPVPAVYIDSIQIEPDIDAGKASVRLKVSNREPITQSVFTVVDESGRAVTDHTSSENGCYLDIPAPHLWSPEDPYLYKLRVSLKSGDTIESYFGMRKISIGKDEKGVPRPMLNNKFVFQSGPLDQGFWPDGIYTAPTDDALRYDIEITKKLGFNMTRKHVKVEPERWYYWCDKLGLLVWQDMPGSGTGKGATKEKEGTAINDEAAKQFEGELKAMVEQHVNHPSIITWVVFNEGWGQYDTLRLAKWVKELDPSRLVDEASGWNHRGGGNLVDMHNYPGPGSPGPDGDRAAVLGEFGGLGFPVEGHKWVDKSWGYKNMTSPKQLTAKYIDLWKHVWELKDSQGLSAAVYTQLTDVETESNGLLTYDRKVIKVDLDKTAAAVAKGEFPPEPVYATVVPTSETDPAQWSYTTEKPADDWAAPGFDASGWKQGPAGFGTPHTPGAVVRTEWKTNDIWIRRGIILPEGSTDNLALRIHHDDDADVYLNGVEAAKLSGYLTQYEVTEIVPAALAAVKPGKNVIAIHCHQVYGGQYIDAGLVREEAAGKK
jgi:hypothetical protein